VTEKDEKETEEDDPSQRAADNCGRPSSIIGIGPGIAILFAATTSGSNVNAGRLALLVEWVSRIKRMRDLARTLGNDVITSGRKLLGETIYTLAVLVDKLAAPLYYTSGGTDLSLAVTTSVVFGTNRLTQKRESSFAPNVMLMVGATLIGTKLTV